MEEIRNKKTIKDRLKGLTEFLDKNDVGNLTEDDSIQFRLLFQERYTENEGEEKFKDEEIQTVGIIKRNGNPWFCIYLKSDPDTEIFCSKKKLAGLNRVPNYKARQAARSVIQHQIDNFKKKNKKEKCPGCSEQLGSEAQVDHEPTFQNLLNNFCSANDLDLSKIGKYNHETKKLEFKDSNISTKWSEYHKLNAKLRWLCKECNQRSKTAEILVLQEDNSFCTYLPKMEEIRNKKTIKGRVKGLIEFLNKNDVGHLSEDDSIQFRLLLQEWYIHDEGNEKFEDEEIQTIGIVKHNGSPCFCIYLKSNPDTPITCGKNDLAGKKRNPNTDIRQAARSAIFSQIENFKKENKLKENVKCPGTCSEQLGSDAQVDHETTFQNLLNDFCQANNLDLSTIGTRYNQKDFKRELKDSTISTKWSEYHKINAKLRWLCKKCNQKSKIVKQNE